MAGFGPATHGILHLHGTKSGCAVGRKVVGLAKISVTIISDHIYILVLSGSERFATNSVGSNIKLRTPAGQVQDWLTVKSRISLQHDDLAESSGLIVLQLFPALRVAWRCICGLVSRHTVLPTLLNSGANFSSVPQALSDRRPKGMSHEEAGCCSDSFTSG